jgi:DNA polymerase
MFIGEGPGEQEDKQGLPFVGRSGQFLRSAIKRAGILDDVFITNVVRCRPPDNRDPEPEEIEACWEWTQELLKAVKPKILVTLGKYSLTTLAYKLGFGSKVRQQSVTKIAGKPIYIEDRHFYCYPMVHPAYAMRGRTKRSEFIGHMRYLAISIPGWLRRQ